MEGFEETLELMKKIHAMKNKDYANSTDPYKNFKLCEQLGACSVEAGIVVRMSDKLSRITNLLTKDPDVVDEKITDTLVDLANYAIILKCYIDQNNNSIPDKIISFGSIDELEKFKKQLRKVKQ